MSSLPPVGAPGHAKADLAPAYSSTPERTASDIAANQTAGATIRQRGERAIQTSGRVYLDHGASTPCDPAVAELMARVAVEEYANSSSAHLGGRRAEQLVERAREQIADAIQALPEEIIFTSGATESNNLAIQGIAAAAEDRRDPRRRIITLAIEHPSVIETVRCLARRGFEVAILPVRRDGTLDLAALEAALGTATLLVSVQAANNEIGTIQPLREAALLARKHGALVHCDAAQAFGKIRVDVAELGLDFASLSAHKCYGPKGIGALWVNGGTGMASIRPLQFGGGQERGLRPGTHATAAIAGFGETARLAASRLTPDGTRIAALRDLFEQRLHQQVPDLARNGALSHRLPGASSVTFFGIDADALMSRLPDVDLSAASACHTGAPEPSAILRAIGLRDDEAYSTLRFGFGRGTTMADIAHVADRIASAAAELRALAG